MEKVKAFADWLTKWFTVIVIVWAVFNYFVPAASLWGKAYTGYMLGIVLFGMGLTLTLDDFKRILTQPLMVIVGTVAHFIIMPLIAVALCAIFHLSGPLAVGVILVGCCPSGTSSNVMSYLSRGDVALDVSIGILSTLCAPFMIPLLMQLLASQYVSVPTQSLFLNAVKVVLFPIALGGLPLRTAEGHHLRSRHAGLRSGRNPGPDLLRNQPTRCRAVHLLLRVAQHLRLYPVQLVAQPR